MKKLLLASAVLVGMGASQAFADATATWVAETQLAMGDFCSITAPTQATLGATVSTAGTTVSAANAAAINNVFEFAASTSANSSLDSDLDGYANDFVVAMTFGDTFCNYNHQISLISQHAGFTYGPAGTGQQTVDSASDIFTTKMPYKMDVTGWSADANTGLSWAQQPVASVLNHADAPATFDGTSGVTDTRKTYAEADAFRNDNGASDGLTLTLTHTAGAATDPYLSGRYVDRLFFKLGAVL